MIVKLNEVSTTSGQKQIEFQRVLASLNVLYTNNQGFGDHNWNTRGPKVLVSYHDRYIVCECTSGRVIITNDNTGASQSINISSNFVADSQNIAQAIMTV